MNSINYLFWICAGAVIAFINFLTQYWSVRLINPEKSRRSKWLVLGGTVIRWVMIGSFMYIALSSSIAAMLIGFLSFWILRLVILNTFTPIWHILKDKTN